MIYGSVPRNSRGTLGVRLLSFGWTAAVDSCFLLDSMSMDSMGWELRMSHVSELGSVAVSRSAAEGSGHLRV